MNPLFYPQQGFTLIETLIALAIFSFGLLAFADALLIASEQDRLAYLQSVASNQISGMIERLYACHRMKEKPACITQEIDSWRQENKQLFPQAESNVTLAGTQYKISIRWQLPLRSTKESERVFQVQQLVQYGI